jgi:hypothetical protein
VGESRSGPGALKGFVLEEISQTSAGCSGLGAEGVGLDTRYVACIAEPAAPGVGVILTDTCTSGFGFVRDFFVGGWSNFFAFGLAYFVAIPSDCQPVSIFYAYLILCLLTICFAHSVIS